MGLRALVGFLPRYPTKIVTRGHASIFGDKYITSCLHSSGFLFEGYLTRLSGPSLRGNRMEDIWCRLIVGGKDESGDD